MLVTFGVATPTGWLVETWHRRWNHKQYHIEWTLQGWSNWTPSIPSYYDLLVANRAPHLPTRTQYYFLLWSPSGKSSPSFIHLHTRARAHTKEPFAAADIRKLQSTLHKGPSTNKQRMVFTWSLGPKNWLATLWWLTLASRSSLLIRSYVKIYTMQIWWIMLKGAGRNFQKCKFCYKSQEDMSIWLLAVNLICWNWFEIIFSDCKYFQMT